VSNPLGSASCSNVPARVGSASLSGRYNALMWTCAKGHLPACRLLLDRGADARAENVEGDSALHIAAANNQLEVLELLLNRGANVDAGNSTGDTALHLRCLVAFTGLELGLPGDTRVETPWFDA